MQHARQGSHPDARRAVRGEKSSGQTRLARGVQQRKVQNPPDQCQRLQAAGGRARDAQQTAGPDRGQARGVGERAARRTVQNLQSGHTEYIMNKENNMTGSVLDPDPGGSVFKSPPGSGSVFEIRIHIQQGILSYKKSTN